MTEKITEQTPLPRGIRNNNPGNIRRSKTRWQGEIIPGFDPYFLEFETPLLGLRALMRVLLTYYYRHGLDTVQSLINRWAPPHENATDSYAGHVAQRLRIPRTKAIKVDDEDTLTRLARAIVVHENGAAPKDRPHDWYADDLYRKAAKLALFRKTPEGQKSSPHPSSSMEKKHEDIYYFSA